MSQTDVPTFTDATGQFQQFILEQGYDPQLQWIFRDDIVEHGFQIFVRLPLRDSTEKMERRYEEGVRRGLGINLHVFCYLNARPLCYIWLPEDETDAEYRMLTGLKLSAPSEPGRQTVVGIRWKLRWVWLRWMERRISKHRWADDIPKQ